MIKSLNDAQIVDGLPRILAQQEWVAALSAAMHAVHERTMEYARNSQIYTAIDTAPETVLDALAVNWKVSWYRTEYTLEEKRKLIKTAMDVYRTKGTAYAVRTQADAIYRGTVVEEWFEYGGRPGCFRVNANLQEKGVTLDELHQLVLGIESCKNVRSHLDGLYVTYETESQSSHAVCTITEEVIEIWPQFMSGADVTLETGAGVAAVLNVSETVETWPEFVSGVDVMLEAKNVIVGAISVGETIEIVVEQEE